MRKKYGYLMILLGAIALTCLPALLLVGCISSSSETSLPDGGTMKARGLSFASKTGAAGLKTSQTLTQTNATRNVNVDQLSTQTQFSEMGEAIGAGIGGALAALSKNPAALSAFAPPPSPYVAPEEGPEIREVEADAPESPEPARPTENPEEDTEPPSDSVSDTDSDTEPTTES